MRKTTLLRLFLIPSLILCAAGCGGPEPAREPTPRGELWRHLEPGLELGVFLAPRPTLVGDRRIRVLRIDPEQFELHLLNASADDREPQSAKQWCKSHGMIAALNASMYQEDYLTSVSLMRSPKHTNNSHLTRDRAVLAFGRRIPDVPAFKIIDLECDRFDDWEDKYDSFVQSIRMYSCKGENVWQPQPDKWSTAAFGIDASGRALFIHVRSPYATHDLVEMLVELPLQLENLMYAEGGPESQLYVDGGEREYEFVGGFNTSSNGGDNNKQAWPIPNVVAVSRRGSPGS